MVVVVVMLKWVKVLLLDDNFFSSTRACSHGNSCYEMQFDFKLYGYFPYLIVCVVFYLVCYRFGLVSSCRLAAWDCNSRLVFPISRFEIKDFVIPGSRQDYGILPRI